MQQLRILIEKLVNFPDSDWERMGSYLQPKFIAKNEVILQPGQICNNIYFILQGVFRTFMLDEKGFERNYLFHFENGFVTDYESFLNQSASNYFIECLAEAQILSFSRQHINTCYREINGFEKLGRLIAEGLYLAAKHRVEDFMFLTPEERYTKLIKQQPEIFKKIPVGMIAEYINVRPQSLSRIRKRIVF